MKYFPKEIFNTALEIGCGIGIISEYIAKNAGKVTALDISEENIKFAKATLENINFHREDFLEFNSGIKFDLITLFDVLEHFPKSNHSRVFKKIRELANSDSIIAINLPDADFLAYMREHHPQKLQVVDESVYFDELKILFDENNLEILKYEKYGIDYDNQYRFYLLGFKKEKFSLERKIVKKEKLISKLFRKVWRQLKIIIGSFRFRKYLKD